MRLAPVAWKFEDDEAKCQYDKFADKKKTHLFVAGGLVGAVILRNFQTCGIYTPAPDVQGATAKSKPLLLRCGLERGWRWSGRVASASSSLP